jgi:site-specific DNA-methyltransferase (adenine-specific)
MKNIVHLIDNIEFMKNIPYKNYDLSIVDPPYGINLKGKNPIKNKNDTKDFNTKWDNAIPDKEYFIELKRISTSQIIWGGNYFLDYLGFCKAPIIWDKLNGKSMYADGEMAWTSGDLPRNLKIFRHQWCGAFKDSERGNINIHPTQKPVALYKWLLKNYAKPGQTIFDSHVGSGSIRIACHDMGFDFEGCEIDQDYWQAQEDRYKNHISQQSLFDTEEIQKSVYEEWSFDFE